MTDDKAKRPHDTFFKETFSDEAKAAAELSSVLPQQVVDLFDWSTLHLEPGSFQRAKDRDRFVDLLFSVQRSDVESEVLVYVLFEHQSSDDWFMPLRMLRYMLRIWDAWIERTKATRPPLPPILPLVLAHDERGWQAPQRFHDLFADDPGTRAMLERYVPSFEFALDDLAKVSDEELASRGLPAATTLSLWALRDGRSADGVRNHVAFWAAQFAALEDLAGGSQDSNRVIGYLGHAAGEASIDVEVLVSEIIKYAPRAKQVVMNSVERLREEGRQEGRQEGRRAMLLELLRMKFGQVADADVSRVNLADDQALERYLERVLTADSIAAVLGE